MQPILQADGIWAKRATCDTYNKVKPTEGIIDEQGLEQGGVSSSDLYKIFGKEQLASAQESKLLYL